MNFNIPSKYILLFFCSLLLFAAYPLFSQKKEFVVVLDPGHGGRDPGAVGRRSKEKDITLAVAKLVGGMMEKKMSDVKVVYTRNSDVFIPLEDRAATANNHHADMFISIHTNAAKNRSAAGAETYTLGLAKTKSNLDVAMTENSVMLLEDDYQTRYLGFDPSSIDSYIMFEFMMDKYLDNSISFATDIQKQFSVAAKRRDRGVRQAGFWVLHRSACPSVLIELGFVSNYAEELYLTSKKGQQELAAAIYNAFEKYKQVYDNKMGYASNAVQQTSGENGSASAGVSVENRDGLDVIRNATPVYKVQIKSSPKLIQTDDVVFKGLHAVDYYREGGLYKYTVGIETDYNAITRLKNQVHAKFPDAFVVAFLEDKKISVAEAVKYNNK